MEENIPTSNAKSQLSSLNIKDLFFKYIRFLPLFVLSVALALFAAYTYLRYTTPIYETSGSLIIREDKKAGNDKLQELMSSSNEVNIQNEIEQLRSRPMMERVVEALNLNYGYFAKGKVKESNIYKSAPFQIEILHLRDSSPFSLQLHFENSYAFRVDNEKSLISFNQVFKNDHGTFRLVKKEGIIGNDYVIRWRPTAAVASELLSSLFVTPKATTKILILTLRSDNPHLAADVINRLMYEYRINSVDEKNETIKQQLNFINGRLAVVDSELDSITLGLLNYQKANNLINIEAQSDNYFMRIQESDKLLTEQQAQLEIINMIESYLRNSKNNYNTTPSTLGIADPTLNNLIAAYNVSQLERKELVDKGVPEGNPLIASKESQIEKLRQNILENLRNIKVSYNASIQDWQEENVTAQSQIRLLPEKQQRLLEIQRQQQTKLAVYNLLLEQRERSSITLAATTSNVRVVEDAQPNNAPVEPNKKNVQMIAIFLGLALPALGIFLLELLNDKVSSRTDVERITDATIIGEVGHSLSKEALVVTPNSRGVVAEQFRIIRSNLQYVHNHLSKPIILVTSSFSGEGKSFISTNMGAVMALAGKRTIILEFDIRKPKILSHLNMPKKPGFTNYLLGKAELDSLPIPVPGFDNFFVLACGPVPPNPSELLLDPKLNDLFDYLKAHFDVIIMDTAPVGMVSDALTLSRFANSTLYIVRQGHTYKKQIALIDDYYHQVKLPKLSIIINDVKLSHGYGYYGYGRYGYGYGSGYFEEEQQQPTLFKTWLGWIGLNGKHKKKSKKEKV